MNRDAKKITKLKKSCVFHLARSIKQSTQWCVQAARLVCHSISIQYYNYILGVSIPPFLSYMIQMDIISSYRLLSRYTLSLKLHPYSYSNEGLLSGEKVFKAKSNSLTKKTSLLFCFEEKYNVTSKEQFGKKSYFHK